MKLAYVKLLFYGLVAWLTAPLKEKIGIPSSIVTKTLKVPKPNSSLKEYLKVEKIRKILGGLNHNEWFLTLSLLILSSKLTLLKQKVVGFIIEADWPLEPLEMKKISKILGKKVSLEDIEILKQKMHQIDIGSDRGKDGYLLSHWEQEDASKPIKLTTKKTDFKEEEMGRKKWKIKLIDMGSNTFVSKEFYMEELALAGQIEHRLSVLYEALYSQKALVEEAAGRIKQNIKELQEDILYLKKNESGVKHGLGLEKHTGTLEVLDKECEEKKIVFNSFVTRYGLLFQECQELDKIKKKFESAKRELKLDYQFATIDKPLAWVFERSII